MSRGTGGDGLAALILLSLDFLAITNFRCPGSLIILYVLNYSDRAFFELARACLTCRSKFTPALACTAASCTPPYEPANIHMFREVMKTADIPKWTIRDTDDNLDTTSAPQCTLPSPHTQFLPNPIPYLDCGIYHYSILWLERHSNLNTHHRWRRSLSGLRSLVSIPERALSSSHIHPPFHATWSAGEPQMDN
jgi:hypothetical protein